MNRNFASYALALAFCAGAHAATINTTLTVKATGSIGATITATGTATLTNIGSGTFNATLTTASTSLSAPFTITLTTGDKISGTLQVPLSVLSGSGTGSATVTGGTGAYAGATGSFPSLSGTGSVGLSGLTLTFTGAGTITTGGGGGGGTPTPTITAVQDAAGNTPNIAQGSIFIVKGANLSASGFTSFAPPRPTTSSGVKVTFTPVAGGSGTDVYLVYLYNQNNVNQVAGILPSTVAVGNYNVTVTNGTAVSPTFSAQVVANKFALFTQDSSGTGLASAQNVVSATQYDLNRLTTGSVSGTTYSPARPGQPVVAYGTGLGAYAAGDNTTSPAFDFSKSLTIQAVVGGTSIPVAYAGRAGYAGEDQINFTLPANIQTGCAVTFQISVNGKLSPPTSLSIAPDANSTACVIPGYTTAQLQKLDQGGTITTGAFTITQFSISAQGVSGKSNSIGGGFTQLTAFQLASAAQSNVSVIQSGSCQIIQATSSGTATATGGLTYLDAGTVTVNGPSGSGLSNQALTKTNNAYSLSSFEGISIPGQANFSLPAGTYSLSGNGGADVSSFNTSLTLASPLTVTGGLPTTVNRSSPLTINWTGGNSSDLVEIIGSTSSTTGTGTSAVSTSVTFICLTTAGQQTFTVPTAILGQLFATTPTNPGSLEVASGNLSTTFTATLKSDGSSIPGLFGSFIGTGASVNYQ
ncbi:MAG TPA: hypothetical protein VMH28_06705 [Candidatus Acidoferrales bacterium]|nr:hypothetical protein [Candidatus Acidoferrales bacterium]